MRVFNFPLAALAFVSGIALSGCAYDMYGDGYGGYGSYGGIGVGYGSYGGYGYGGYPYGYGYGPYGGYGYGGYGYDPFGWYGGYYYPGSGIYVYDRYRHRREMTGDERRHWHEVFARLHQNSPGGTATTRAATTRENWSGFTRGRNRVSDTTSAPSGSDGSWTRGSGRWNRPSGSSQTTTTTTDRPSRGHWRTRGDDHQ
jgi:hypothetical protein